MIRPGFARLLAALGCLALLPWLLRRLVGELWLSAGGEDYFRNVFARPVKPWLLADWWWWDAMPWYDALVMPALACIALAIVWPWTGAKVCRWIAG